MQPNHPPTHVALGENLAVKRLQMGTVYGTTLSVDLYLYLTVSFTIAEQFRKSRDTALAAAAAIFEHVDVSRQNNNTAVPKSKSYRFSIIVLHLT